MPHVQIRDIEEETLAVLRARAGAEHLSLAQYLRRELRRLASTPTMAEVVQRADRRRERLDGGVDRQRLASANEDGRADRR